MDDFRNGGEERAPCALQVWRTRDAEGVAILVDEGGAWFWCKAHEVGAVLAADAPKALAFGPYKNEYAATAAAFRNARKRAP